jgi:hypothetical protein
MVKAKNIPNNTCVHCGTCWAVVAASSIGYVSLNH